MSEQITLFDMMYSEYEISKKIRLIEIFSGYGSQSMALRNLGADFEHYRAYEIDKYAMASYNAIHGTGFEPTDVKNIGGVELGIVDKDKYCYLLTYSFPCTDISIAGQQKGMAKDSGTRSSLLWEVERILNELNETDSLPQVLLMENVSAIHNEVNKPHYQKWIDFLHGLGYSNYGQDLNSADFGIPQHRERQFLLSILGDYNFKFPTPMELTRDMDDFLEDLTEEQALNQVVKSEKAHDLLVELDAKGELED